MIIYLIAILIFISIAIFIYGFYPLFERLLQNWQKKRVEKVSPKLDKMFIDISPKKLLLIDIVNPLAAASLAFFLTKRLWIALLAAFAGLVIPTFIVKHLEILRRRRFSGQLVDGLMLLSGSLKAGLSLLQAFEALVEEMPPPISQEFSLVVRENRMGVPLEDCLSKLKTRMASEELDMIVTAILVAKDTGGDITTIFSNLVMTIRERNKLLGRVRALCMQGQLQGRIMMALPIVFGYGVYKLDPTFFNVLLNDPQGKWLLAYAVVSEIIGIILISRMSKIEI